MTARKFSEAAEALRKIVGARSRGEAANFHRSGIWLVYRSRFEAPTKRIQTLVQQIGGTVHSIGKSGRTRRDSHGSVIGNPQPYFIEFDITDRDTEVFIEEGTRIEVLTSQPRLHLGRLLR